MNTKRQRRFEPSAKLLGFGLAAASVTALVGVLLRHTPEGVFTAIVNIAAWMKGGAKPEVVTWPAWGYAFLVAAAPSFKVLVVFQACISVLALTALAGRLWKVMPRQRILLTALLLMAVPWHNQQLELYPSALAGSLTLLALLCLDNALAGNAARGALLAGALAGLAQNFRTEFLFMPAFLGICIVILKGAGILKVPSLKPLLLFIVTALALQLPWAAFYRAQNGRFSLTESNLGHVLYVSLGAHPRNPWGIKGEDRSAFEAVRNAGHSCLSMAEEGDQCLQRLVLQKVKEHPVGVAQRTVQQLKNTILAPFNWGEPRLDAQGRLDLDVLREELKSRLGAGVNVRELQDYRERGLYPGARRNMSAVNALAYQFCCVAAGSLVMLLGLAGMALALVRRDLRPPEPLLYLLGAAACYKIFQDVLLCYQVNYLVNVYPMFLPFVAITLVALAGRLRSMGGRLFGSHVNPAPPGAQPPSGAQQP